MHEDGIKKGSKHGKSHGKGQGELGEQAGNFSESGKYRKPTMSKKPGDTSSSEGGGGMGGAGHPYSDGDAHHGGSVGQQAGNFRGGRYIYEKTKVKGGGY